MLACLLTKVNNRTYNRLVKKLRKLSEKTLKNSEAKEDYKKSLKNLQDGVKLSDIGKGGRYFGNGLGYIRKGDTRIFYEQFVDEVKIIGVDSKGDSKILNKMVRLVDSFYPFIDINYKNL